MFGRVEASSRARRPLAEILRRRTRRGDSIPTPERSMQFRGFDLARR